MAHKLQLVHAKPGRTWAVFLSSFLFVLGIWLYLQTAHRRHQENADDRIVPTISQMARSTYDAAFKPAEDDEQIAENASVPQRFFASMRWTDTVATSRRFLYSILLLIPAAILGLHMGLFPYVGVFFLRFVLFFDKIIALSVLPILFIAFGIDELSKIMLIVIGVTPTIILDTFNLTRGVPNEQIVKAFTLGAGDFDVAYRVVLGQIAPRVLNSIRLNLKAVMLFLFAGEMIASTNGLAYRIALLRRHMGMDVIIPYVLWVALLLFLVDLVMRLVYRELHPWIHDA